MKYSMESTFEEIASNPIGAILLTEYFGDFGKVIIEGQMEKNAIGDFATGEKKYQFELLIKKLEWKACWEELKKSQAKKELQ